MKYLFALALPALVGASEWGMYKDAGCMESVLEYKTSDGNVKHTWSKMPIPFATGVCTEFAEPIEYKQAAGSAESKMKFSFSYATACSEYGSVSGSLLGKSNKDCTVDKDTGSKEDNMVVSFGTFGVTYASYCYPANYAWEAAKDEERYIQINCNPNNAQVLAIILGVIGLVLSFAAIGLAAVAMGKKGGSSPPPAKPAAPAAPAGEAAPQGSTTAAATVGAATEA